MPFLMAQKPLMPSAFLAALQAAIHGDFLPLSDIFLLTTFPDLFLTKSDLDRPVAVLAILPATAWRLASFAETFFIALATFMAFMAAFIALAAFMTFMAAMADRRGKLGGQSARKGGA